MIVLRADDQVDNRGAADDLFALGLCDAAGDRDNNASTFSGRIRLQASDATKFRIDLLGRLFPNVTGVENEQISILGGGFDEPLACEQIRHPMGIVDVHLAAVGFDVELARAAHGGWERAFIAGHSGLGAPLTYCNCVGSHTYRVEARGFWLVLADLSEKRNAGIGGAVGWRRAATGPRMASIVSRRTVVSSDRATDLRSDVSSKATGSPQVTTTSMPPRRAIPRRCGQSGEPPYQATSGRC